MIKKIATAFVHGCDKSKILVINSLRQVSSMGADIFIYFKVLSHLFVPNPRRLKFTTKCMSSLGRNKLYLLHN